MVSRKYIPRNIQLTKSENLNKPITSKENESVIKNLPPTKGLNGLTGEFCSRVISDGSESFLSNTYSLLN